ncbi:protein phosphatase 2C [Colletotrichum musicola]|uniref:Protein phosphatase 2C n=1 Tax=Colletotrichum musicola TaxID=2175873 RepID=A0A8H6MQ35_9PEZI|nr:protein phosphatase 2C [Colletotrichum musicola]
MLQRAARRPNAGARLGFGSGLTSKPTALRTAPRWTRPSSTGPSASPSSKPASRTPLLVCAFAVSAAAGWGLSSLGRDRGSDGKIPRLGSDPVDLDDLAQTPVDAGNFQKADEKIREDVFIGSFTASGKNTHVHAARVSSNYPVEDMMTYSLAPGVGKSETLFNGVYDGHAGWATSVLLKKALIPAVSSAIARLPASSPDSSVDATIVKAFTDLDDIISANAKRAVDGLAVGTTEPGDSRVTAAIAPAIAGSCALLSIFDPSTSILRVACTGDSRAVLGSASFSGTAAYATRDLSKDQNGHNKSEFDRLAREHPGEEADMIDPKSGRLFGIAVTRAFGDHRWKWDADLIRLARDNFWGTGPRPKASTPPYMTAAPVVTTTAVNAGDFVILASDGLWDHISSEHAVECVSRWIAARRAGKKTPDDKLAASPGKPSSFDMSKGWANWAATPEHFVVEDLDNAAVHLVKNALGGNRRTLFTGAALAYPPLARNVRDDVTVQVIFFQDPSKSA